ncbi:methyltransferase domain-containing protein [Haloechinothrix sp. LS1_15]|uniref:class I SAM-dependent methyltransferase n=1 Tax=Haloechinothrix sp. LS1_15 TaxID=2652248 RepID=UPI002948A23A|nr:methyltransferase domain-containing protein [Haloechinothrix sp. LS1_15]MDV6012169.1 methyltransferase domain-containing protein [Haloechinothrix sp. LS1_15]
MRNDTSAVLGSSAVGLALEAELARARERGNADPHVVDVGGGSGGWAVPLATQGCRVTVVEPNPNAIATLQRRADEEGVRDHIAVVANDSDALATEIEPGTADLVLAHGLLEVVDDPAGTMAALAATVTEEGAVSVLTANKHGAVLHKALAGRFAEARQLHAAQAGVVHDDGETLLRRFDVDGLRALHHAAGLDIVLVQGEGVVPDSAHDTHDPELAEFERATAASPPLRDIASRLHVLARRVT